MAGMSVSTVFSVSAVFVVVVMAVVVFFLTFVSRGCVWGHNNFTVFTVYLRSQTGPEGWVINRLLPTNRGMVMNFEWFLLRGCGGCGFVIPGFAIVSVQDRICIRVCIRNVGIRRRVWFYCIWWAWSWAFEKTLAVFCPAAVEKLPGVNFRNWLVVAVPF